MPTPESNSESQSEPELFRNAGSPCRSSKYDDPQSPHEKLSEADFTGDETAGGEDEIVSP